jgi:hypothetical protein
MQKSLTTLRWSRIPGATCKLSWVKVRQPEFSANVKQNVRLALGHNLVFCWANCAVIEMEPLTCRQSISQFIVKTEQHIIPHAMKTSKPFNVVRFEVFTAVTMKNAVFWDIPKCGSCKNRHFGGTYRHHQGDKNRMAKNNLSILRRNIFVACVSC